MMRRATWLAAGAVFGVLGYRRLDRAAKSLTSNLDLRRGDGFDVGLAPAVRAGPTVRAGPALRSVAGHSIRAVGWLARRARTQPSALRRSGGVAGFLGDVRAGMDEYLDRNQANIDRQYRRSGNTLVAQRATDRAAISGGAADTQR